MTSPTSARAGEPQQLTHERELGFVPLRLAGLHAGSQSVAGLYAAAVPDVRKHAYQDFHALTFALGGDDLFCVDPRCGVVAAMRPGTLTVQPAEVESVWRAQGVTRWLQFYVSTALVRACALECGVTTDEAPTLERLAGVDARAAVRVLYACAARLALGTAADAAALDAWGQALAEFLVEACQPGARAARAASSGALSPARLAAARDYVAAGLGPGLTASAVAAALGMSRFQFTRAFAAATGETPYVFIQRERLRRARDLVACSSRALADIAIDVGYAHQGHMSMVFSRELGVSPARLRAVARRPLA